MDSTIENKKLSYDTIKNSIKNYPVRWLIDALEYRKGNEIYSRKTAHLCICGYSQHVSFIDSGENPFKPFIINGIEIMEDECLDGKWCLDTQCKYNKTTGKSYAKNYHLDAGDAYTTIGGWDKMVENFRAISKILDEDGYTDFKETGIMQGPGPLVEFNKI
jgi:hypothetical protein